MAKKAAVIDLESKKKASKKSGTKKKQTVADDLDDFDAPVFIDPNEQAKAAIESQKKTEKSEVTDSEKEFSVEVTAAKITNEIFLYAAWKIMSKNDKGSYNKNGENPIHEDLKKAFSGLNAHMAKLSYQYNEDGQLDTARVMCRGFSIGSNGEGVTLHGTRHLPNNKSFNFNTPFYKWTSDEPELPFAEETNSLKAAVNICRAEVIKYLFKHKYQPEIKTEESSGKQDDNDDDIDNDIDDEQIFLINKTVLRK